MIYAPNITKDKTYGIGNWTDGEILFLLRTGIKKDGKYAPPYMAKLPNLADKDMNAIISFLRSEHPLVAADPTPDQPSQPSFLTKFLCQVAFGPFEMPKGKISMPDTANQVAWGKYLAHNLDCFSCHSADFKTNNFLEPEKSEGYFAGGNKPLNLEGKVVLTPNLTPDPETGIGKMTEEQFIRVLKTGLKEGTAAMQYPMFPYDKLSDKEASAIFKYLKTIPPIKNKVERVIYD
jgi:mono/diheme cytochrome c family protein